MCPFQKWFGAGLPSNFEGWEESLRNKYEKAWAKAGSPSGIRLDDHDYDTVLGQGNTLSFVVGSLSPIASSVPQFGLFKGLSTRPVVVRISDFGATDSALRLARMAIKIPLNSSWSGEANLLFTETMDAFPMPDYSALGVFADSTGSTISDEAAFYYAAAKIALRDGANVYTALHQELAVKKYYSQANE